LCLSPAVATVAGNLAWQAIETATRPDLPSMLALVDRVRVPPEPIRSPEPAPKPEVKAMSDTPPSTTTPATPPPAAARPSAPGQRPRGGIGAVFLAGIIGAVIAGAALLALIRLAPGQLGLASSDAGAVAALNRQLSDVSTRLATLEQQVAGLPKVPGDI